MKLLPVLAILAASASTGLATRLVCYYANWSRFGTEPFKVEDIDAKMCTHIVYTFFGLENDGRIKSLDSWNDFGDEWTEGGLKKFLKLKAINPSVKLLLGVGGWNEGAFKFQAMVQSPEKRRNFLESTLTFIRQYKLDGLEIDWVYHGGEGTPADKEYYPVLLREMRPKYKEHGLMLALATSGNPAIFEHQYKIPALAEQVDYIHVMTYDLHGSWDKKTGHVAPLHPMRGENAMDALLNVETVIRTYLKMGAPVEKLNLAVVTHGRTFTLADPSKAGMNAPTKGPGKVEPLPYRTFCVQDKNNFWKKMRNDEQKVPFAVSGDQWVGYEDTQSLKEKVKFVKSLGLKGISFWSLDMDDFKGNCGTGKYPLLKAVNEELYRK